jgi:hypothetical protein
MHAIELIEDGPTPLVLHEEEGALRLGLVLSGLDEAIVRKWLARIGNGIDTRASAASLATLVVCTDRRVEALAREYATAVGAPFALVAPAGLEAMVEETDEATSVTAFLLADALDEALLHSFWRANRGRARRRLRQLPFGLMTGLTSAHLAWLVAKTLIWLSRPRPLAQFGFADYDGFAGRGSFRTLSGGQSAAPARPLEPADWSSDATHLASLFTHSVSFDAQLGKLALCGHIPGLESRQRSAGAPSCFFDGVCFRLDGSPGAPTAKLEAVEASPLLWFLNGCGAVPLAGSAFGVGTGYAHGLLAGAALSLLGSHITQVTNHWRNTVYGALLATGATTGESALALSRLAEEDGGFHPYPLLGSPDLRLAAERPLEPVAWRNRVGRFEPRGAARWALRVSLPKGLRRPPVTLGDDGGTVWQEAEWQALDSGGRPGAVFVFEPPRDLEGWVELGPDRGRDERLRDEAAELRRRLRVLRLYEFAQEEAARIDACEGLCERLLETLAADTLVRRRTHAAALLAILTPALDELQSAVCGRFVAQVLSRDFNLDRESHNGFVPGTVRRTRRLCRACGSALFAAVDRWSENLDYRRTKRLCANCFGVSMALDTSPVRVSPLRLLRGGEAGDVALALRLRNASATLQRAWVAAAPRHGASASSPHPFSLDLEGGASARRTLRFDLGPRPPGTQSLRVMVLAAAAAQFHNFKLSLPAPPEPQIGADVR